MIYKKTYKIILLSLVFVGFFTMHIASAAVINKTGYTSLFSSIAAYYTFDGPDVAWNTNKTTDRSGQGLTANIRNMSTSTAQVSGKLGSALLFDGSNDLVDTGSNFISTSALTICAWFNTRATTGNDFIFTNGAFVFRTGSSNRYIFTSTGSGGAGTATNAMVLNKWQYACFTRDASGTTNMYIDGALSGTANQSSGTPTAGNTNVIIGNRSAANLGYNGRIDDVRFYLRELSANEIAYLYNIGSANEINISPVNRLTSGLLGYWTFDGVDTNWNTNRVTDRSGNARTGTLTSMSTSTSPTQGKIGQGLFFDGINDLVSTAANFIGTGDITSCTWSYIKTNAATTHIVSNGSYLFGINQGNVTFRLNSDGATNAVAATNALILNKWQHVCVTRDSSGTTNFYVDGALSGTANQSSGTPTAGNTNVIIGNRSDAARAFNGKLDDVRIYSRILTTAEIQQLYTITGLSKQNVTNITRLTDGLMGYWTFDGRDTDWSKNITLDRSGNNRTGTSTNMSTTTVPTPGKIGQGFLFDGVNDMINTGSNFIGTGDITACAWTYTKSLVAQGYIFSNGSFILRTNIFTTGFTFNSNGSTNAASANNSISLNRWIHICVTRDSSGVTNFYINSVLSGTANQSSGTPTAGNTNLIIGNRNDASLPYPGKLDDVRIYSRVLSTTEILQMYNLGR